MEDRTTRNVGVFRTVFPLASEAFIATQAAALKRYRPLLVTRNKAAPIDLAYYAMSERRAGALRAAAFAVTHHPLCFGRDSRLRDLSLLHAHFGPDGVSVMPLARKLRIPLVVTFHGGDCTVARRDMWLSGKLYNYHFLLGEERLKKEGALFLAVSGFLRGRLLDKGYPDRKVRTHYIGVDTEKFKPADRANDDPYILCVGRHVAVKGIDVLLRAFSVVAKRHPALSLVQVGAGPLTGALQALAHTLGIAARVRLLGAQPNDRIAELMRGARVFALPSQEAENGQKEALGIVLNEASACGVPVVATRQGGIPEAVRDGETGFLVAEKDDAALADRLDTLLADAALARRMGRRGREYVCEVFDLRKQTQALELIYDEVARAVKKVLIIETFIPHYRVPFFEGLHDALRREKVDLRVAYGQQSRIDGYGYYRTLCDLPFGVRTRNFWLFNARVLLQPVLREVMRADLVIVEQASKHLLNYFLLVLSRLGIKTVALWGHGWNRQNLNRHSFSEWIKARLVRFPSWWFAYTEGTARYLRSKGVHARTITVVQNSVDVKRFRSQLSEITDRDLGRARSDLDITPESRVGLFCGRLHKDKKLDFLLLASREIRERVPDFHLIIIGEGPEKNAVKAFADEHGWAHYVGARIGREKALYFRLAHVILNPGLVGLGILDAFTSGLPIIVTDIPIHSPEIEYLENGRNGVMCRPVPADYADAVVDVLTDQSLYRRLREDALASVVRYSLEAMVENFKNGILRCLG